jgi:hypothetical protein
MVVYIVLKGLFVYNAPDFRHQEAGGFILRPSIERVVEENPGITWGELLDGAEYDPTRIWVEWTVNTVRISLLIAWLAFFGAISFVLSVFVLLQHYRHEDRKRKKAKQQHVADVDVQ